MPFTAYIYDPFFVPTLPHIQATFFDRVRVATRRTLVRFAAKHAVLEIGPIGQLPAAEHADRMAAALRALAGRDRTWCARRSRNIVTSTICSAAVRSFVR